MIVIRLPKTFWFNSGWLKDDDENLKYEIEFIIKYNGSLAENQVKNETEQLLLKEKHGDNIHEQKAAKRVRRKNLFITCHKDQAEEIQTNMLLCKTYPFITPGRTLRKNSISTINL